MKAKFSSFAVLVVLASLNRALACATQTTAAPVESTLVASASTAAATLVERAIVVLEQHRSISAKCRQRVYLFDRQIVGSGTYVQGPSQYHWLRVTLRIQAGNEIGTLQQVCDGRQLWIYHQLGGEPSLKRVDLPTVLRAMDEAPQGAEMGPIASWVGIAGLPRLLRSLGAAFDFAELSQRQLGQARVWLVRGTWRSERLAALLPNQKSTIERGQAADLSALAEVVPDHVLLYLGCDDLFPHRIEFRRVAPSNWAGSTRKGNRPLVISEWFDVELNGSLSPHQFVYQPGNMEVKDYTAGFLADMGLSGSPLIEPSTAATTNPGETPR